MIWLYPASLRRDYRQELLLTFRNQAEDTLNSGSISSAMLFGLHMAADWLRTLALERDVQPATLSLLGLSSVEDEASGYLDQSTFSTSLLLAVLGIALLIAGWYEWLKLNEAILNYHRSL
jgi:hypothetical protein